MLIAENIHHAFHRRRVLHDVSLRLAPGEVLGLGGASGAGKSTLGRILAGQICPDAGHVIWDGLHSAGARAVQHVPQSPELAVDPRWTVARVLENGAPRDPAVLAALGIRPAWLARHPGELSGGELARVSLARFFLPSTRVLICDEITAQLDALTALDLWRALLALVRSRGMSLIVISHDDALRGAICGRQLRLAEGRLHPIDGNTAA